MDRLKQKHRREKEALDTYLSKLQADHEAAENELVKRGNLMIRTIELLYPHDNVKRRAELEKTTATILKQRDLLNRSYENGLELYYTLLQEAGTKHFRELKIQKIDA